MHCCHRSMARIIFFPRQNKQNLLYHFQIIHMRRSISSLCFSGEWGGGGGGVRTVISKETYIATCDFPEVGRGSLDPLSPLWIRPCIFKEKLFQDNLLDDQSYRDTHACFYGITLTECPLHHLEEQTNICQN